MTRYSLRRIPWLRRLLNPWLFRPVIEDQIDRNLLAAQAAEYFSLPLPTVERHLADYLKLHEREQYERRFGEKKTLCFEEAFLIYVAAVYLRPKQIVEIGTYTGKSTQRILDIIHALGLQTQVICFDIVDEVKYFDKGEATLHLRDVTHDFPEEVLQKLRPDLIYLDAHPYHLLKNVISHFVAWPGSTASVLAIHDCGLGLYNPNMKISKDDPGAVTSRTGHWERHVLSEVFATPQAELSDVNTGTHRLRIFHTPHGLAMVAANDWLRSPANTSSEGGTAEGAT